jgi:AcrR family transcriptional regulator
MTDGILPSRAETRRDRRIARKRSEIMTAVAQVFAQRGYAGTTTKDIAQAADVGESTLYNYFQNKRDIFIAIASQKAKTIDDLIGAARPQNPQEMIGLMDKALEIILSQAPYTRSLLIEAWMDNDLFESFLRIRLRRVQQFIQDIIAEEIAAGNFRPMDPVLGARILIAMTIGAVLPVLRGDEAALTPEQRHAVAETIITVLLNGLKVL